MTKPELSGALIRPGVARPQFRVWHLWLLSVFVAVAIVNIRDQRRSEPALVGLAMVGFVLYAILGWGVWAFTRRLRTSLGAIPGLAMYLAAMAALFFIAAITYLVIEHAYLVGW